ncbi:unnamed protein product [Bursaphelenchus okinawaensis]|uniref:Uncharacterized protein n=1 Tax=Bursaphelenchus okinawaensis TaxID=465554 RepID=A0A811LDY3_9BILA|nr:unnamed protein product [Bursaphelenchus okinawaensis]CAG9120643.1 unnamed protein product [Bursaphelenchus okinawaensis]
MRAANDEARKQDLRRAGHSPSILEPVQPPSFAPPSSDAPTAAPSNSKPMVGREDPRSYSVNYRDCFNQQQTINSQNVNQGQGYNGFWGTNDQSPGMGLGSSGYSSYIPPGNNVLPSGFVQSSNNMAYEYKQSDDFAYSGRDGGFNDMPGPSRLNTIDERNNTKPYDNRGVDRRRDNRYNNSRGNRREDGRSYRRDKRSPPRYNGRYEPDKKHEDFKAQMEAWERSKEDKEKQRQEEEEKKRKEKEIEESEHSLLVLGNEDFYDNDSSDEEYMEVVEDTRKRHQDSMNGGDKKLKVDKVSSSDDEEGEVNSNSDSDTKPKLRYVEKQMYSLKIRQIPERFSRNDFVIDENSQQYEEGVVYGMKKLMKKQQDSVAMLSLMGREWDQVVQKEPSLELCRFAADEDGATKDERINYLTDIVLTKLNTSLTNNDMKAEHWLKLLTTKDEIYILKSSDRLNVPENEVEEFLKEQLKITRGLLYSLPKKDLENVLIFHLEYSLRLKQEGYLEEFDLIFEKFIKSGAFVFSIKLWKSILKFFNVIGTKTMHYIDEAIRTITAFRYLKTITQTLSIDQINSLMIDLIVYKAKLHVERGESYIVVAMLQAFTEFNYFFPDEMTKKAFEWKLGSFSKFWNLKLERIGEKNALTWKVATEKNELPFLNEQIRNEAGWLRRQMINTQANVNEIAGKVDMEKYVEMENIRMQHFWQPLKFDHDLGEVMAQAPSTDIGFDLVDEVVEQDINSAETKVTSSGFLKRVVDVTQIESILNTLRMHDSRATDKEKQEALQLKKTVILKLLATLKVPVEQLDVYSVEDLMKTHLNTIVIRSDHKVGFLRFLVRYMATLSKIKNSGFYEELIATVANTIEQCFINKHQDYIAEHWPAFSKWTFDQFFASEDRSPENLFLRGKLLQVEANIKRYSKGAQFVAGNLLQGDKDLLKQMIDLLVDCGNPLYVAGKKKIVTLWMAAMVCDYLEGNRKEDGLKKADKPVLNKARLLWMYTTQQHTLTKFFDENIQMFVNDEKLTEKWYQDLFEAASDDETSWGVSLGNAKDLSLKLWDMIVWEVRGKSLYETAHKNRSNTSSNIAEEDQPIAKVGSITTRKGKLFRLERIDQLFCHDLLQRRDRYYEWTTEALRFYPFDSLIWPHAIRLESVNPKLEALLPEDRGGMKEDVVRVLHQAIKVVRCYQDVDNVTLKAHTAQTSTQCYVRSLFEGLIKLQINLPFAETFSTRLAMLMEMDVAKRVTGDFETAQLFFKKFYRQQTYSKILKMAGLELMTLNEFRNCDSDQFKWFTNVDEVDLNKDRQ